MAALQQEYSDGKGWIGGRSGGRLCTTAFPWKYSFHRSNLTSSARGVTLPTMPSNMSAFPSRSKPTTSYTEAEQRVSNMRADEQRSLHPDCLVKLMTHERRVERAIVFMHGYLNGPPQFEELGRRFFDLGYNVLIAPLPHHGLLDRMSTEHSRLTVEELTAYGDEVLDIGRGLGQRLIAAGLSGGGVVTAWAAQNRPDVALAVMISPAFGFKAIPTRLTVAAMHLFHVLPNSFNWWDPVRKDDAGPFYAYTRYATHALTQFMRLGFSIRDGARGSPPAAGRILVVINPNDDTVNNELTLQLANLWRQHSTEVTIFEFPASLGLPHDLIDPSQPNLKTELVYPVLVDLITGQPGTAPQ